MSVISGANIATNGLLLNYDMNNIRSWRGMPVTNQFAIPTPDSSSNVTFAIQGTGTFQRLFSGTYGGYTITNNDVVYKYDLGLSGCHYHGNAVTIPIGVYPVFTFDYYISPDAANYVTSDYLANFENYSGGAQSAGTGVPNSTKGIWQTMTFSGGLTSTSGTQAMFLYPGGCGNSYLASSGYILYKNPQVLFASSSGFTAPFSGPTGARSNTQSILDLTGKNVITAASLNYSSNNTFSFDATKYMTAPMTNLKPTTGITQEVWFSTTTNAAQVFIGAQYGSSTNNSYALWINAANELAAGVNIGGSFNYTTHSYTLTTNTYYHFVHTYDGTNQYMYMNGSSVKSWATTGTIAYDVNNTLLAIGNDWNGPGYDTGASYGVLGTMPVVRIYDRALSAAEVAQNFNAQRSLYNV